MSNYAIMRFQKYSISSVPKIERHQQSRFHFLKNLPHPERIDEDITWKKHPDKTMSKVIKEMIKNHEQISKRKFRKDGISLVEFVMTFSPEMENSINFAEWHKANLKWLEQQFGKENIIRFDTNNMETTRHGHYFITPVKDGKFNATFFFGKKSQIVGMQDSYAKAVEQFGLARGESKEITKARHKTIHEWHKEECERLENELIEMANNILADEKEIAPQDLESDIFDELR